MMFKAAHINRTTMSIAWDLLERPCRAEIDDFPSGAFVHSDSFYGSAFFPHHKTHWNYGDNPQPVTYSRANSNCFLLSDKL